jgi:hypothetical protein
MRKIPSSSVFEMLDDFRPRFAFPGVKQVFILVKGTYKSLFE